MGVSQSAQRRKEVELILALCDNDLGALQVQIEEGVDVDCFDDEQSRPLHVAASLGREAACRALLSAGADVKAQGQLGGTPLHAAASANQLTTATLLLEANVLVDARDESALTPLHRAAQRPASAPLAQLLLDAGAHIDARNVGGYTPLHVASMCGYANRLRGVNRYFSRPTQA